MYSLHQCNALLEEMIEMDWPEMPHIDMESQCLTRCVKLKKILFCVIGVFYN